MNKYIKLSPTPKQSAFIWLNVLDAFYGGAAGGGKTIALLMAALQYVDCPEYNAILIRDTYKNLDMPGSLMNVAEEWLTPTDAHWDGDGRRWVFPSGASLSFGYLDKPKDHFNYQSANFHFVGIDEVVNIRENQALYLFSRLRKLEGSDIPIRFRCASNPPAPEQIARGGWVKDRYVNPETREDRIYIPAKIADNPKLNAKEYEISLHQLDPITRQQLLEGDWDIKVKGRMFNRHWFEIVVDYNQKGRRVRYWDLASTEPSKENKEPDWTVGLKMLHNAHDEYIIESIIRTRKKPLHVEQLIRQTADMDGKEVKIYMEQEPGASGKAIIDYYRRKVLPGFSFYGDKPSGSKVKRSEPFASQAEAGNVKIVSGYWNSDFLDEIDLFPDGEHDDQVDGASGAFDKLSNRTEARIRVI